MCMARSSLRLGFWLLLFIFFMAIDFDDMKCDKNLMMVILSLICGFTNTDLRAMHAHDAMIQNSLFYSITFC